MRLRGQDDDQVDVRLSFDELVLMRNVLHEVCNGMHLSDDDFVEIFDITKPEIESLLLRTTTVLDRLGLIAE